MSVCDSDGFFCVCDDGKRFVEVTHLRMFDHLSAGVMCILNVHC